MGKQKINQSNRQNNNDGFLNVIQLQTFSKMIKRSPIILIGWQTLGFVPLYIMKASRIIRRYPMEWKKNDAIILKNIY